jgi:hypothetical protein
VSSRTFIRIYSPDELSQKIIGSNELSLNAIKVTRFRENKRSNEVTKKATTPFFGFTWIRNAKATSRARVRRNEMNKYIAFFPRQQLKLQRLDLEKEEKEEEEEKEEKEKEDTVLK